MRSDITPLHVPVMIRPYMVEDVFEISKKFYVQISIFELIGISIGFFFQFSVWAIPTL